VIVFSGLAIVGIILTVGSNVPFNFYSTLLFEMPFSSSFRNLLRDPDKLSFLISFAYSYLLSITSYGLLTITEKIRFKKIISGLLIFVLLAIVTITPSQIYKIPFENSNIFAGMLIPAVIPEDFNNINNYIKDVKTDTWVVKQPMVDNLQLETLYL